jgi:hypothetical protein
MRAWWDQMDLNQRPSACRASKTDEPVAPLNLIKILPFKEKDRWELVAKYNIGRKLSVQN